MTRRQIDCLRSLDPDQRHKLKMRVVGLVTGAIKSNIERVLRSTLVGKFRRLKQRKLFEVGRVEYGKEYLSWRIQILSAPTGEVLFSFTVHGPDLKFRGFPSKCRFREYVAKVLKLTGHTKVAHAHRRRFRKQYTAPFSGVHDTVGVTA